MFAMISVYKPQCVLFEPAFANLGHDFEDVVVREVAHAPIAQLTLD